MRQVIPFSKEIVFKTNIASITSISLEHEEKIFDGEISGDFIIFGDYKIHSDTTEKELFKYRLPFTAIIPDTIDKNTVRIDIEDFTYEQIEVDVIKVNIDFSLEGDEIIINEIGEETSSFERLDLDDICDDIVEDNIDRNIDEDIDEFLSNINVDLKKQEEKNENMEKNNDDNIEEIENEKELNEKEEVNVKTEKVDEYVTYHIHIVKDNETLEMILKKYNVSLDIIKEYNEITDIKVGDKIIVPEYVDE